MSGVGELSNIAQLTGLDAVKLIGLIVQAANTARMHKKNCRQFAQHLKLIGNLLEQLKLSELRYYPETREPLEQLEDALRRAYILVDSCQNKSYLYLLAMGWNIVYQFRRAQDEVDRYLRLVPLITLVDNARVREKLEIIEQDKREYTLDEEDRKAQDVILDRDPSSNHATVIKKSLSCSYPKLPLDEALRKENEKLHTELQWSQVNMDAGQYEVIQHLIGVTQNVAMDLKEASDDLKKKKIETYNSPANDEEEYAYEKNYVSQPKDMKTHSRTDSAAESGSEYIHNRGSSRHEEWNSDLLGCCSEPALCLRTFVCPCGTLSQIASAATNRSVSPGEVCNDLMAYSLVLSCCCYTCCVRRKLRKVLNIEGGLLDDLLSHLICCCCALVQERREMEFRGVKGPLRTKITPPTTQYMET